jgi:tripartite-type tricarboxylate transporter receptor subunit TctC
MRRRCNKRQGRAVPCAAIWLLGKAVQIRKYAPCVEPGRLRRPRHPDQGHRPAAPASRENRTMLRPIRLILVCLLAAPACAMAQPYPSQPIKVIVPFTAGSPNDVVARLLADGISKRLGENLVIENRPGAGTTIGTKAAAAAEANGYTLLFTSSSIVVAPEMYRNPGFHPLNSFVPVANAVFGHWVTVIEKSIPASNIQQFIAYAKANPGKLAFGFGQGTAPQLVGEWFKVKSGLDVTSVPYKGGAGAVTDMLGGRIHLNIGTTTTLVPLVKSGKVKAISVWSPQRLPDLPDVSTMIESGFPGVSLGFWAGLFAPAGTPDAIVKKLNEAVNASLNSPETKARLAKRGLEGRPGSPAEFANFIKSEWPRWADIVKTSGVKVN